MRMSSPSLASKSAYSTYATCGVVAKLPGQGEIYGFQEHLTP